MATLIGVLVDVSGSMKENVRGGEYDRDGGTWARSIFDVIDDLIKHDVTSHNKVFASAFGASCGNGIFDIFRTIEEFKRDKSFDANPENHFNANIDTVLEILQNSGAYNVRRWAQVPVIREAISANEAALLRGVLEDNTGFRSEFVDCLPPICKDTSNDPYSFSSYAHGFFSAVASKFKSATVDDIREVVSKAKGRLLKEQCQVRTVKEASNIVHGSIDKKTLNRDRLRELMKNVEPFIYGRTPMFRALNMAVDLMSSSNYSDFSKLLFVLSDGEPTDSGDIYTLRQRLERADITVVGCCIRNGMHIESRRLFSTEQSYWENGAKFLYRLSSKITTQVIPRTIFLKQGWKIDIENNETKLFLQVNHPDNVHDVCDFARNVVCCQDALSDLLVSVDLDIYINQETSGFIAPKQVGGTCYANASAAVVHLVTRSVLGRDGGYPNFNKLREDIIAKYGLHGENTLRVLQEICPNYRLQCKKVDLLGALKAVSSKRPVVATFYLTEDEWRKFKSFYNIYPKGILSKNDLGIARRNVYEKLEGHAVVLTSYNSQCLRFMNSWGSNWADMGFFRVEDADVLKAEFIDVFWTSYSLTSDEKRFYKSHGASVANKLIQTLKGLQNATYRCDKCGDVSNVNKYTGNMSAICCPKCHKIFKPETGNILVLNLYLTSLSE